MAKLSICKSRHNRINVVYGSICYLFAQSFIYFQEPCPKQRTILGSSLGTDQAHKVFSPRTVIQLWRNLGVQ